MTTNARKILMLGGLLVLTMASSVMSGQEAVGWSDSIVLDMREGYCGHLVRRQAELSARAEESEGLLTVDGVQAQPLWDSTAVEDGLHTAKLQADEKEFTATLAVLNSPDVVIHEGEMTANETWTADKVHVVRHWVRIPKGRTLTIEENAIVKFCDETGLRVDGTVNGLNVFLTSVHDDSRGGDTDMNGSVPSSGSKPRYGFIGDGIVELKTSQHASCEYSMEELENREDYGGRLVRGEVRLSSLDKVQDEKATLMIDTVKAVKWTFSCPQWPSTQVADGWHDATLTEQGQTHTEALAVLNRADVIVHGGVLTKNETWTADKLHIVKHWVRIPENRTLTIATGTVVKICPYAGIRVDGVLNAHDVVFTSTDDDMAGGDTDLDGNKADDDGTFDVIIHGNADLTDSVIRHPDGILADLTWTAGSVHVIHETLKIPAGKTLTMEPGAIVKLATGARLVVMPSGNIVCEDVIFTHLPDDSIGGDTEKNGNATTPVHDKYELIGFVPPESCDLRYLSLLYRGWNLFAPGADILDTSRNRSLLKQFNAFEYGDGVYQRVTLPRAAGSGLWLYCPQKPCQVIPFDYGTLDGSVQISPETLAEGWNLTGVPGEAGRVLKLGNNDCVWEWTGCGYELIGAESDGRVKLRSGKGYFIFHAPQNVLTKNNRVFAEQ